MSEEKEPFIPRPPDFVGFLKNLEIPCWREIRKTDAGMEEQIAIKILGQRIILKPYKPPQVSEYGPTADNSTITADINVEGSADVPRSVD